MGRRSIPEIRAAAARQAEIVRELAAEVEQHRRRRRQRSGRTTSRGLMNFLSALAPVLAPVQGGISNTRSTFHGS